VCFYIDTSWEGGSWCYSPPGYTNVPDYIHDNAVSFSTPGLTSFVYVIDWARGNMCYYRKISPGDHRRNWDFGRRLDGVDSVLPEGCQPG
jgi:hypothetical protein